MENSRRIGRSPQLSGYYGDASSPSITSITGAAKLTGRTPGGLAIGVLEALTDRMSGPLHQTLEPRTSYTMLRALQDFDNGNGSIGVVATGVNRTRRTRCSDSLLRREAYVGGRRFPPLCCHHQDYELKGSLTNTHLTAGSPAVDHRDASSTRCTNISAPTETCVSTRRSRRSTATPKSCSSGKLGGDITRFQMSYQRQSAGYDPNDLGYLHTRTNKLEHWAALNWQKPSSWYRSLQMNFSEWNSWTMLE